MGWHSQLLGFKVNGLSGLDTLETLPISHIFCIFEIVQSSNLLNYYAKSILRDL